MRPPMVSAVVGIDLSLTNSGVAIVHPGGEVTLQSVKSSGKKDDTLYQRRKRLHKLRLDVINAACGSPTLQEDVALCIEAPSFNSKGGHAHDRSGLWWMVIDELRAMKYPVTQITPAQRAKYATGKGNAGKGLVIDAAARRWPHVRTEGDDNLADALVIGMMGAHHYGVHETKLPKVNLEPMDKIDWAKA